MYTTEKHGYTNIYETMKYGIKIRVKKYALWIGTVGSIVTRGRERMGRLGVGSA